MAGKGRRGGKGKRKAKEHEKITSNVRIGVIPANDKNRLLRWSHCTPFFPTFSFLE